MKINKKNRKFIIPLLVFSTIIAIFQILFLILSHEPYQPCKGYFLKKKEDFRGIITKKFDSDRQRDYLEVRTNDNNTFWVYTKLLFKHGEEGDSIVKKSGNTNCTIKKRDTMLIVPYTTNPIKRGINCEDSTHLEYYN